jgi:hypothetical protein
MNTATQTLAVVLGRTTRNEPAFERKLTQRAINLGTVGEHLDRGATAILRIVAANPSQAPFDVQGDALGDTYARELDLFEGGHLDCVGCQLAAEILVRAQRKSAWPKAANKAGLVLIDVFLVEFVDAITPLLATQGDLLSTQ